jgi:hypothetical protein
MQINIGIIRINVITNVGSFNVGKTILCNNRSSVTMQPGPAEPDDSQGAEGAADQGGQRREPTKQGSVASS